MIEMNDKENNELMWKVASMVAKIDDKKIDKLTKALKDKEAKIKQLEADLYSANKIIDEYIANKEV